MRDLQERLRQRHPRWFDGHRGRLTRPLLRRFAHWSRLDDIGAFVEANRHLRGLEFATAASAWLDLRYHVDAEERLRIPARGRLLVVANHPSGALDALALLDLVGRVRDDVRIVANHALALVEPLAPLLLPVAVFGDRPDAASLRAVAAALREERCVIVFPAGEVSRLGPRGVRDPVWRRGFLRFARATSAPVLPVRIEARNSSLFYGVSALYKPAATALLAREMFAKRPLRLRVGWPSQVAEAADDRAALRQMRRTLYAIGRRQEARVTGLAPIAVAQPTERLREAMSSTELLGATSDGRQLRLACFHGHRRALDMPLLLELGRLRELAFRRVGEGCGRSRDLDGYDAHYEHILLWDAEAGRIAGAYRVAHGAEVLARHGLDGLYTASLFRYADDAIPRIAAGVELGRSFVTPDYQGGRSLDELWQGIGMYLARHPGVRYLFGAVSISGALPRAAREHLVAYYRHVHGARETLATARRPFVFQAPPPDIAALDADAALALLRAHLAAQGAGIPMLYRQYVDLCEPGGAQFLAFGVDPGFRDAVDGLVEVDLRRMRAGKRRRYFCAGHAAA